MNLVLLVARFDSVAPNAPNIDGNFDVSLPNKLDARFSDRFSCMNELVPSLDFRAKPENILFGCVIFSAGSPNGMLFVILNELPSAESNALVRCTSVFDALALKTLLSNNFIGGAD